MTTNEKVLEILIGEIERLREELSIWKGMQLSTLTKVKKTPPVADSEPAPF